MKMFPLHAVDFYKTGHYLQYPDGTTLVYSNLTPRADRLARVLPDFDHKVVMFGLQGVIKWLLQDLWNTEFFNKPKEQVIARYKRRMDLALGPNAVGIDHIAALHDLGYLPIVIKALPEGSRVNIRVPLFTIRNTRQAFYWLPNYLETQLSAELWKTITSATTAYEYKRLLLKYAEITGSDREFVKWQGHDFSARGMSGIYDAAQSGAAHLLSFYGTDTIAAIDYLEDYYEASRTFVGGSVPATEHSVMCMGGQVDELGTFRRLITETYPTGIVSIVSDTWDFWKVINEYSAVLKPEIMARQAGGAPVAKVVFRPDSGDPVKIICGDGKSKGAVEALWDIFGGTITSTGHKLLDSHVGLIYGDSITLERATAILEGLAAKGFASGNIVLGIGSFTYQHVTRDTFGLAMKATYGEVDSIPRVLFKDPITDSGTKKSAKGLLRVEKEGDDFVLYEDQATFEEESYGEMKIVFANGKLRITTDLEEIRERLNF